MQTPAMKYFLSALCATVILITLLPAKRLMAASIMRHDQTASGLTGWRVQDENIKVELNPLQKDQVRAFYLGRGFSAVLTERIADACVYQTIIENVSDPAGDTLLEVKLPDWRILSDPEPQALRSKENWIDELTAEGASAAATLAFKWATFPAQQYFKLTGDYGWGMILFGKQAAETFDLRLQWYINGERFEQLIAGLNCPD
jgi:hypothetical protein